MTQPFDDNLLEWGERLFKQKPRTHKPRKTASGLFLAPKRNHQTKAARVGQVRHKLASTTKRTPEVMVKISGTGRGMNNIRAHMEYIARNGQVELENEIGESIVGRDAVHDLQNEWKNGLYGIPEESHKREAFNIVFSMPPGTDRAAVKMAVREFATAEFAQNHQYVFAAHDDERHPHVHLCVKALGIDGTRLNPRKQDLQHWREQFAEKLREHGIEANATPRIARGIVREGEKQSLIQMRQRNANTLQKKRAPDKSLSSVALAGTRKFVTDAYHGLARTLAMSADTQDRKLAVSIVHFVKDMPLLTQAKERTREPEKQKQRSVEIKRDQQLSSEPPKDREH